LSSSDEKKNKRLDLRNKLEKSNIPKLKYLESDQSIKACYYENLTLGQNQINQTP